MSQVKIPKSVPELGELVTKIEAKSNLDGDRNILLPAINIAELKAKADQMLDYHRRADEANRLKEELNEQKNKLAKELKKDLQQVRTLLKAHFPEDIRKLSAWGFNVDDVASPRDNEQ